MLSARVADITGNKRQFRRTRTNTVIPLINIHPAPANTKEEVDSDSPICHAGEAALAEAGGTRVEDAGYDGFLAGW